MAVGEAVEGIEVSALREAYVAALKGGDRRAACSVVTDALKAGLDVPSIYLDILQPALREIGRLWQENEITVADEHLATAITQLVMARCYDGLDAPEPRAGRTLIAACAETERHEVGLRMVCDLLEREGWDVTLLGATVPAEDLARMVAERKPDAVILSATIAPHLPQLQATIAAVREASGDRAPFILVGGRPFHDDPAMAERLGADATASDAAEAVKEMERRFG